jgi:hypothetical protein
MCFCQDIGIVAATAQELAGDQRIDDGVAETGVE